MVAQLKTKAEFDACISGTDQLVVVDFTASWCGPCQRIAPMFVKWAEEYPNVTFVKIDVDENEETAAACEITAMPTFKFFKGGKEVKTIMGANADQIKATIEQLGSSITGADF